jgi:hypothetical protein
MGTPLSPDEIRAAAAVHHELGPEYADDVVASFLDRIDQEITARIDARLGARTRLGPRHELDERRRALVNGVVIGQLAAGIPLTVFAVMGQRTFWPHDLVALILLVIVALNVAVIVMLRRPRSDR